MSAGSPFTVVVAVGTDHHPFDRLVKWADRFAGDHPDAHVIVQHGTAAPPTVAEHHALLPAEELRMLFEAADAIVCHGGPATIVEAREAGRLPISVPRRPELGEHVDGHQVRFVGHVAAAGQVRSPESYEEFVQLLERAMEDPSALRTSSETSAVHESIARFAQLVEGLFP